MDNFEDDRIEEIEKIVREDFSEMLQCEEENVLKFIDNYDIFGLYKANHQRFRFLPGEKSLIHQIVKHVKSFKSEQDKKPLNDHFIMPKNQKQQSKRSNKNDLCWTPIGYLFGNKLTPKATDDNINIEEENVSSKESLLLKLNALFQPFSVTTSVEMITIKNTGQRVYAEATCILCKDLGKCKQICIQYDVAKNSLRAHWNMSNFSKHLQRHGNKLILKREIDNKNDEDVDGNPPKMPKVNRKPNGTNIGVNIQKGVNDVLINLDDYTKAIYDQISQQNLKLTGALKTHNETIEEIMFKLNDQRTVNVIATMPDGSCMFSSLAHQIYLCKVNSAKHVNATKKLRERVVKHIVESFDNYKSFIAFRLKNSGDKNSDEEDQSEKQSDTDCRFFVNSLLSKSATWGGTESLKAISELEKVNIIIFSEDDTPYFSFDFNPDYKRTVAIAHRLNEQKTIRNHYDSIAEVNQPILYDVAVELAKNEKKKSENKKKPNDVIIVS